MTQTIKFILSLIFLAFVSLLAVFGCIIESFWEGKKAFYSLRQLKANWALLLNFAFKRSMYVGKKYTLKLYGKVKNSRNQSEITFDFDNMDFFELFSISYLTLYTSFLAYIILTTIVGILTYSVIYVNPEVETATTPPTKDIIAYQQTEEEVNEDLFCPCTEDHLLTEEQLLETTNTLLLDNEVGTFELSSKHVLTTFNGTVEVPVDFAVKRKDDQFLLATSNGLEFIINTDQGFVFKHDLYSIYYIAFDGTLYRISR